MTDVPSSLQLTCLPACLPSFNKALSIEHVLEIILKTEALVLNMTAKVFDLTVN